MWSGRKIEDRVRKLDGERWGVGRHTHTHTHKDTLTHTHTHTHTHAKKHTHTLTPHHTTNNLSLIHI